MKTKISSYRLHYKHRSQAYPVFALQFVLTIYGREAKDGEGLGSINHVSDVRWMQGGGRGGGAHTRFCQSLISSSSSWLGLNASLLVETTLRPCRQLRSTVYKLGHHPPYIHSTLLM